MSLTRHHRRRRAATVRQLRLLAVLGFRYSVTRDAYVLGLVGSRLGPVFQVVTRRPTAAPRILPS